MSDLKLTLYAKHAKSVPYKELKQTDKFRMTPSLDGDVFMKTDIGCINLNKGEHYVWEARFQSYSRQRPSGDNVWLHKEEDEKEPPLIEGTIFRDLDSKLIDDDGGSLVWIVGPKGKNNVFCLTRLAYPCDVSMFNKYRVLGYLKLPTEITKDK